MGAQSRQSAPLLTVDQLPTGWVALGSAINVGGVASGIADATGCAFPLALTNIGSASVSNTRFALPHGQLEETVNETVETFNDAESTSLMASLRLEFSVCVGSERADDGNIGPSGALIASSLTASPSADLGDDELAYQIVRTGDFTNMVEDLVVVRIGSNVMLIAHANYSFETPELDSALTCQIAEVAARVLVSSAKAQ